MLDQPTSRVTARPATTRPAPPLPPVVAARVDDPPRIYEQSLLERFASSLYSHVVQPDLRSGSLLAIGGGVLGGTIGGGLLGRRFGHGLLGAGLGALVAGGAALGATMLPTLLHDPRATSGGKLPRPRLAEGDVRALVDAERDLARDSVRPDAGLGALRNAHVSNTAAQLRMALEGDFNALEGDVRLEDGIAVMSHDRGGEDALLFADWLRIGVATGKHLRIDLKEAAAIDQVSALLHELEVPDEQVTLNVSTGDPASTSDMTLATLHRMRDAHPNALIGFNLPKLRLGDPDAPLLAAARDIGGPTQVSIAIGDADADRIAKLRAGGVHVGVWNDPTLEPVDDPAAVAERLRSLGVDGLVDLRAADDPFQA